MGIFVKWKRNERKGIIDSTTSIITLAPLSTARGAKHSRKIFHLVFLIESISLVHYVDYLLCLLQWPQPSPGGHMASEMIYSVSEVYSRAFTQQWLPGVADWTLLRGRRVQRLGWKPFFSRGQENFTKHEVNGKKATTATQRSHDKALNFQSLDFVIIIVISVCSWQQPLEVDGAISNRQVAKLRQTNSL